MNDVGDEVTNVMNDQEPDPHRQFFLDGVPQDNKARPVGPSQSEFKSSRPKPKHLFKNRLNRALTGLAKNLPIIVVITVIVAVITTLAIVLL